MLTKEILMDQLGRMGILPTDTVLIHTSLKAVGAVENGADGFLDAFCAYLSDGLFLVPTHTWDSVYPAHPCYDVRSSVPCIGVVPQIAAFRRDGIRSLHPTHSIWACGRDAEAFVQGEENAGSPAPVGFCWDKLADRNAKILLIGVGHNRNTFIHSVDERANLTDRLGEPFDVTIVDRDGSRLHRTTRPHCCSAGDVSRFYVNFEKPLIELGAQTSGVLGNAEVKIVDAAKCRQIIGQIYARAQEDIFKEYRDIPEELYR